MEELDDNALLREYVDHGSQEAFATLVARHVNKVYSVALRHTGGNPHHAEEITQAVFVILSIKSRRLNKAVVLSGWLYQTARLTAVTFIRSEIRRSRREEEAHMQNLLNESESDVWHQVAPLLDAAMARLSETDRHAVVLRFFDGKSMREVGAALGANESAAKKRVNRAVERLRSFFSKRGVVLPAAVLTAAISASSVQAAPLALASSITGTALQGGPLTASTLGLASGTLKAMTWLKIKFGLGLGAVLLAGGVATVAVSKKSEPPATKILQQVKQKYASLSSYSETLRTTTQTELPPDTPTRGGKSSDLNHVKLARPNSYRIQTEENSAGNPFAIWSTADGNFWLRMNNQFYRSRDEPKLDSIASPFFTEPTVLVPAAFFGKTDRDLLLAMAASADLEKQPDEKLSGVDCYTLFGSANVAGRRKFKMTIWVGKNDFLIRQARVVTVREVQLPTAGGTRKPYRLTHTIVQTHENIQVNQPFSKEDFHIGLPAEVQPSENFP